MLGIHIDVAVTWQRLSAGDWMAYAADVSRRESRPGPVPSRHETPAEDMNPAARCPACDGLLPDRDPQRTGRKARYCSGACKARAYRARRQAGGPAGTDGAPLPAGARHARAVEIRQRISELAGTLADTASGQHALFPSPGSTRRAGPGETARDLHQLITELTALAMAATVTKRVTIRRRGSRNTADLAPVQRAGASARDMTC